MPLITTALAHLIIILIIGIVASLGFNRLAGGWLSRQVASNHSDVTAALVGIAGAFIGFHIGVVLELLPQPLVLYLLSLIGALATLWLWRGR
jgi:CBS domain containing-hemolysin-like protein